MVMLGTHKPQQQATLTNRNKIPGIFFCFRFRNSTERISQILGFLFTMRPEMITQIIRKQFFCVTDVCVIGKLIPRKLFCVIGVYRKYLMEAPELHKRIPARKLCVTDVLCNGEINSQLIKCVCNHLGLYSIFACSP